MDPDRTLFFAALGVTLIYGAVSGYMCRPAAAMILTLTLVVGVLIFETLMQAFVRRLDYSSPARRQPAGLLNCPMSLRAASASPC